MLSTTLKQTSGRNTRLITIFSHQTYSTSTEDKDRIPLGPNDKVTTSIKNRNPLNLEKMRIGYKPTGFQTDSGSRNYWNGLHLSISSKDTTASVTHWTGRTVCSASTKEWAIAKFLYSTTDIAAVKIVGKVLGIPEMKAFLCEYQT